MTHGIAIVGMACRYPGARTPAELWENVLARRRAFRRMPAERLRLEDYLSSGPDGLYSTEAALLEDWELDRIRFRVAGGTYRAADLTHWLALDVAAQALADAGFPDAEGLPRDAFGVLVGNSLTGEMSRANLLRQRWPYVRRVLSAALREKGWESEDFLDRLEETYKAPFPEPTEESLAGGLSNTIAGRICNHFDLHGGGFTVDGACASSLLAVAQACSALAAGDLDAVLAGGVDVSLDPFELVGFARTGALARGEMRVYDARSDGFIPGEGCGFVLLLREEDAARLGCRVHAVIRGWGISSDGSGGISRPEAEGQRMALSRAWRRAGFGMETAGYLEGHGTGTAVGDATELQALSRMLRESGARGTTPVGSIKANIGHTKAAAGAAGLIKAVMALSTQILPPNTGCEDPHPELAPPLRMQEQGEVWPADRPLRAGVSAMGFGGINVHVVLEGAAAARRRSLTAREREILSSAQDSELILLAAPDTASLIAEVEELAAVARRISRSELADLAASLHSRRGHARAAVVAASPRELAERLERLLGWLREGAEARTGHGVFLGIGAQPRRIGFLFPGQGSPSYLSGGALRDRFEDLYSLLPRGEDGVDTSVAQPAIVTHSLAGLSILDRLGIRAAVALGHSLGELTALCWASACDEETAVRIAEARGKAMAACPPGGMASVEAPAAVLEPLLPPSVVVAAFNGPSRTVISGDLSSLEIPGYEVRRLRVSHAFHSPLMAGAAPELARHLEGLKPLSRPVASTVSGGMLDPGTDLRELLVRQLTAPVRFTEALDAARGLADLWIEVGPGRALSELASDCRAVPLDAGGPSLVGLLEAVGAAFALGVPVETGVLFEGRFTRPFRVPRFLANPCESAPDVVVPQANAPSPALPRSAVEGAPALEVVRRLVAEKTELPEETIQEDSRLLSDLHLNSISVGQLVAEAARRLGMQAPASPMDFSRATVAEIAQTLQSLSPRQESAPAGVDSWVRAFQVEWVPRELRRTETYPLHVEATRVLPLEGGGALLCLPPDPDESHAGLFLEAARLATSKLVVVGPGGGFARAFHLERPEVATRVVDLPFDHPDAPAWLAAEVAAAESGYGEARYDESGRRTVPVLRLLPDLPDQGLPLGPSDVLLVTGGGKGIGAECALDLARATGARLALLGRSRPENDPELAANLERMPSPLYVSADVTDPESVAAAIRRIESELGPVTALLHAAGTNTPRPISALDEQAFRRTLAPKVAGLRNLLAALGDLRLLVSFGSIIGRAGLEGEADYATANDWLALLTDRYGREHPGCRCLTLEWSVWSGVGMGERLGTLESLIRRGITPIPPETGVARLREVLSRPVSSSVVIAGRFGEPPTLEVERTELPLLRFLEKPRVFHPGIELVVDTVVSVDTDPHLADHVFRGEPLFAAVLGLEAMAQAAMALLETREVPVFEQVELRRPVAVPHGRSTTIRVAALARGPNEVEVVLRDASTGFAADCFRAVCRFERTETGEPTAMEARDRLPLDPADLYGGLFFHRGRFRRVDGYRRLRATECLAEIVADGTAAWFGRWLPNELVLGDPGARDAAIHGIQACIPHAVLLPTGVDRIVASRLPASEPLTLAARERSRQGDDFVYDLEILDAEGRVAERWEGLRLHAVERIPAPGHAPLIGPYVERRLEEILPAARVRVVLEPEGDTRLSRRPDGRPDGPVSRSHAGGLVLSVEGDGRLGCDLEPVAERSEETWRDLLGDRFPLAGLIARELGETSDAAATRVWAAAESLKKAGAPQDAPLTLEKSEADGWLLLRSGELRIGVWLGLVRELDGPAALAVLVEGGLAGL